MTAYLSMVIPAINFCVLLWVLWMLRSIDKMRSVIAPTCLRTGDSKCFLLQHPELLCSMCHDRVIAAIRAAHDRE